MTRGQLGHLKRKWKEIVLLVNRLIAGATETQEPRPGIDPSVVREFQRLARKISGGRTRARPTPGRSSSEGKEHWEAEKRRQRTIRQPTIDKIVSILKSKRQGLTGDQIGVALIRSRFDYNTHGLVKSTPATIGRGVSRMLASEQAQEFVRKDGKLYFAGTGTNGTIARAKIGEKGAMLTTGGARGRRAFENIKAATTVIVPILAKRPGLKTSELLEALGSASIARLGLDTSKPGLTLAVRLNSNYARTMIRKQGIRWYLKSETSTKPAAKAGPQKKYGKAKAQRQQYLANHIEKILAKTNDGMSAEAILATLNHNHVDLEKGGFKKTAQHRHLALFMQNSKAGQAAIRVSDGLYYAKKAHVKTEENVHDQPQAEGGA